MAGLPNLTDIPDLAPVAEGDYDVRLVAAKESVAGTGRKCAMFVFEIIGEDNAKPVFYKLWYPLDTESSEVKRSKWITVKEGFKALGLPLDGSGALEDIIGEEYTARLSYVDNGEYLPENEIKRILT